MKQRIPKKHKKIIKKNSFIDKFDKEALQCYLKAKELKL